MNPIRDAEAYIDQNYVYGPREEENSFWKHHVVARAGFLALTPLYLIDGVAGAAIGLVAGAFAVVTLGQHTPTNECCIRNLLGADYHLSKSLQCFFRALNPNWRNVSIRTPDFLKSCIFRSVKWINPQTKCFTETIEIPPVLKNAIENGSNLDLYFFGLSGGNTLYHAFLYGFYAEVERTERGGSRKLPEPSTSSHKEAFKEGQEQARKQYAAGSLPWSSKR